MAIDGFNVVIIMTTTTTISVIAIVSSSLVVLQMIPLLFPDVLMLKQFAHFTYPLVN